ncbi:MAG: hypothetical protein H6732_08810 [Alphaproteobacteria bacterium]|nr:hypothetical protein [Alphaproteobacteria bacterium]
MGSRFDELKAYVRFGDEDAARLAAFWPTVAPHTGALADAFYVRIEEFDDARDVFEGPAQVDRLKQTLQVWMRELLLGPHDAAYAARRESIGRRHVAVGLAHHYMFTAMSQIQDGLVALAEGQPECAPLVAAVRKITMIDLALMTGTYLGTRLASGVQDLATVLVAHLPTAAFLLDEDGRVATATAAARRLCETDPAGRLVHEVLPPSVAHAVGLPARLGEVRRARATVELSRVDLLREGHDRSFRVVLSAIDHERYQALLVLDELTEIVAHEALRRRHEALVQLGSMSAAVAHELRNALASISGPVQVLAGSLDPSDRRREIMGKVHAQVGRLDRMVHDLLAFSRPPAARLGRVAVHEVADAVCEAAQRDDLAAVVTRVGTGEAWADADLVHRVLLNLVQNAARAAGPSGHVEVLVTGEEVVVADDGPGVDEAVAPRLFEPFFTTSTQGTGLGLAICQNAAEAMGARLELLPRSPLGGAAFRLVLQPLVGATPDQ